MHTAHTHMPKYMQKYTQTHIYRPTILAWVLWNAIMDQNPFTLYELVVAYSIKCWPKWKHADRNCITTSCYNTIVLCGCIPITHILNSV